MIVLSDCIGQSVDVGIQVVPTLTCLISAFPKPTDRCFAAG